MSTNPFARPRRAAALVAAGAVAAGALALSLPAAPTQAAGWTDPHTITAGLNGWGSMEIISTGVGDAVAVWIDGTGGTDRVRSATATDGTWGPMTWVSPQGIETSHLQVEANDAGDVVAVWLSQDDGVNWKVRGSRLNDDGTWSSAISLWHNSVASSDPSTAIDGDGTVHVAFRATVAGKETVQARTWEPGQSPTGELIAPEFAATAVTVGLDVNEAGQAVLSYGTDQSIDGIYATEYAPGAGWAEPEQVSFLTDHGQMADAVIDGAGRSTIFFQSKIGPDPSDWRLHSNTENQNGAGWTVPVQVAAPAKPSSYYSVDTDASGRTLVAWATNVEQVFGVSYSTRASTGGAWSAPAEFTVPDPLYPSTVPKVSVSDHGTQLIDYLSGGNRITKYRTGPALNFSSLSHDPGYSVLNYYIDADVDNAGNAALIERWNPEEGLDEVRVRMYDLAGPSTTLTAPTANTTKGTTIPLAWTATDEVSGVDTTDVSVTAAPWNQAEFGQSENAIDDSTENSGTYAGTPGTTYCFVARSIDKVNNLGAASPQRCTTLPVDDASLSGGEAWTRKKNAKGHYLKTYSTTTDKGAKLTLKGVKAKRLALVIRKSADGGKAVVRLGTQKLKTVNFEGTGKRKVVKLAKFETVRSGKVTITVITDGLAVDVDGLIVAK